MAVNFATLPSLTPTVTWDTIPVGIDPVPYAQLRASGKYTQLAIPDTFPWMFTTLAASDVNFQPGLLSMEADRSLDVHVVNQSGGGKQSDGYQLAGSVTDDSQAFNTRQDYAVNLATTLISGFSFAAIALAFQGGHTFGYVDVSVRGTTSGFIHILQGIFGAVGDRSEHDIQLFPWLDTAVAPIVGAPEVSVTTVYATIAYALSWLAPL